MEGYGDRLARGASSAIFGPNDGKITQAKWDAAFADFDPEEFKKGGKEENDGKSGVKEGTRV